MLDRLNAPPGPEYMGRIMEKNNNMCIYIYIYTHI